MRQKLKQYLGLVEGAAKEQEGRTTSAEDLQVGRKGMSLSLLVGSSLEPTSSLEEGLCVILAPPKFSVA